jgi:transposase
MTEEAKGLFGALARQDTPDRDAGTARYVEAQRDAIVFERFEFDALIGADHPARIVWAYVERIDLSGLYGLIRARAHTPGRPPPDPRVVLALWLYACIEGVGSARQLERLTEEHNGFRWLRGGVPLNYHLLSDFRWQAAAVADRLLTEGVVALWSEGLIDLASLSHDGVRIRASAGASSFPAAGDAEAAAGRGRGADRAAEAGDRCRSRCLEPAPAGGARARPASNRNGLARHCRRSRS